MKKVFYCLVILFLIVLVKFFVSSYSITYKVGKYDILEEARDKSMYFEIKYENNTYSYKIYEKRKLTKKRISSVKKEEVNGFTCLTPNIKGYVSYTMCSDGKELVSKDTLSFKDDNYEEDFYFSKNLSSKEYIYIWKYDGFYFLNGDKQKSVNIFDGDRYSNDLMFQVNDKLIFPSYKDEYLFSDFIVLDIPSGEYFTIKTNYSINYSSKIVGNSKNSIYIFDNKDNVLYQVNYKKKSVEIIGSKAKGYVKLVNGRKRDALLKEYTKEDITYFDLPSSDIYVKSNVYSYVNNKDISIKYFNSQVSYVSSYKDNIYFIYKDNLYRKNNQGIKMIVHNFEFNFNSDDLIFVYNK